MAAILVLNSGSSSLKFGLYDRGDPLRERVHGQVRHLGQGAKLIISAGRETTTDNIAAANHAEALHALLPALAPHMKGLWIAGVGHRIVHGGPDLMAPAELTEGVRTDLEKLIPLAPLHQPHNLSAVEAACAIFPGAVQIGCFDTAFHRGHQRLTDTFALPRALYEEGVRRYGFHGLSYNYITQALAEKHPQIASRRLVIAHLGNGASMCAVQGGKSVSTTMGFSALDGMPMGTRCGDIDPGVILYLAEQKGMTLGEISTLLYKESGLLGLSGVSSEMQELLLSDRPEAAEAVDYFVLRAQREIASLSAVLGGLDGLVFSGGIGENSPVIRERIVERLGFLGIKIDATRNNANATEIGCDGSNVLVIPTDEEVVIARAVETALAQSVPPALANSTG